MAKSLNFKQELVAVLGKPVAENPTQPMMEAAFRAHGLAWRYLTVEVDPRDLGAAIAGMRAMGFRGGNCTIPHKVAVTQHLDRVGESASLMGAVNCIVRQGDELVGENTDGKGFVVSVREQADPAGKRVVILGAGGAARAIGVELALAGARDLTVVNRSRERGEALVRLLREKVDARATFLPWEGDVDLPEGTDILVQATSLGLFPAVDARVPLNLKTLPADCIVADVIPNPPKTRLLEAAAAKGCRTLDGLGMLVNQGVIGFRYWTGIDPDPAVMRAALEEVFGS